MKHFEALACCLMAVILTGVIEPAFAQEDTLSKKSGVILKQMIVPAALIATGSVPLLNKRAHDWDISVQQAMLGKTPCHIDDYAQFLPMAAVYGLNLCGVKGKNDFRDRTTILVTSSLMMFVTVKGLKYVVGRARPNGLSQSFPSGHTATAFVGAEFLWMEYKDTAPWIGYAGFAVATGVGLLRVYNDAHYLSDVIAGAGFGILSVKVAYWIQPALEKFLFGGSDNPVSFSAAPCYDPVCSAVGIGCTLRF